MSEPNNAPVDSAEATKYEFEKYPQLQEYIQEYASFNQFSSWSGFVNELDKVLKHAAQPQPVQTDLGKLLREAYTDATGIYKNVPVDDWWGEFQNRYSEQLLSRKPKKFYIDEIQELIKQVQGNEITISKMVEILNAAQLHHVALTDEQIEDKAKNYADEYWKGDHYGAGRIGFKAGFKAAFQQNKINNHE